MYLQHHGSQKSTDKTKNTLLYALWVLYALSATTGIIDTLGFSWCDAVGSWQDAVSMITIVV